MILETEFEDADGRARLIDFMPVESDDNRIRVVRLVRGIRGTSRMRMELNPMFGYGRVIPRVRRVDQGVEVVSAPNAILLHTPVSLAVRESGIFSEFTVSADKTVPLVMTWCPSYLSAPNRLDWERAWNDTETWWSDWIAACAIADGWRECTARSFLILKALTHPAMATKFPKAPKVDMANAAPG